ncbi:MAG: hypothetical protein DRP08_07670 [Candidatus Aenigmatarchaeota archaeon]|nr:MAG: hypothetical protein DRP08_07670 [Candidatus Aenigmarchaeota archaeon]
MEIVGLGKGKNFEVIGFKSYLKHNEPILPQGGDYKECEKFILGTEELILSGGSYAVCYLSWYREVIRIWTQNNKRGIIHLPFNAIYSAPYPISEKEILSSVFITELKVPFAVFLQ